MRNRDRIDCMSNNKQSTSVHYISIDIMHGDTAIKINSRVDCY